MDDMMWMCVYCMVWWNRLRRLFLYLSFFFFHKSKKCWRSYAYAHVMNHWWCMTCYNFFLNLDDGACMDAWMHGCMGEICFIQKDELLMYAWLGMMYEFFFCISLKTIFELILISLLFLIHGVILLWFFFYFSKSFSWSNQFTKKHFFNHFFETLFEWHTWNSQGLEKVWMRWWRLIRELPQFELVSGHKMCLGFPSYGWYEENDGNLKKK